MAAEAEIIRRPPRRIRAALVGSGIGASLTPALHMSEGAAQGLVYRYDLIDTAMPPWRGRPLGEIIAWAQREGLSGLNITYPHKQAVLAHLELLSPVVQRVGAANTVLFGGGRTMGHNTDCLAFERAFSDWLPGEARARVLLLGAGGGGAAVAHALLQCGTFELLIHDPETGRAEALASRLRAAFPAASARVIATLTPALSGRCDGVVNATPVGMATHPGTPIHPQWLHPRQWLADIIYFPRETALLAAARRIGCACLSGDEMAIWQAVFAFGLITGLPADPARMRAAFGQLGGEDGERGG